MPISRSDCAVLVRQVQTLLRERAPDVFELVALVSEEEVDPRHYLMTLLAKVTRVYSERSGGAHGDVLDRINEYVHLPDGSPVRGVSVLLTPVEQEIYGVEEYDLAELPDRSEFVA